METWIKINLIDNEVQGNLFDLKYSLMCQDIMDCFRIWEVEIQTIEVGSKCLIINKD